MLGRPSTTRQLGLAKPDRRWPIAVDGFFTSQRMDADGYLQSQITVQFVQRDKQTREDLGGLVPMGGVTVVADGEGYVRYVIAKSLPSADADSAARAARTSPHRSRTGSRPSHGAPTAIAASSSGST